MPIDARAYLDSMGDEHCARIARRAGTTLGYFKQIAYRHRRPSPTLARELVKHSKSPKLDFEKLLFTPLREPRRRAA